MATTGSSKEEADKSGWGSERGLDVLKVARQFEKLSQKALVWVAKHMTMLPQRHL
jgi:hypothetical protein